MGLFEASSSLFLGNYYYHLSPTAAAEKKKRNKRPRTAHYTSDLLVVWRAPWEVWLEDLFFEGGWRNMLSECDGMGWLKGRLTIRGRGSRAMDLTTRHHCAQHSPTLFHSWRPFFADYFHFPFSFIHVVSAPTYCPIVGGWKCHYFVPPPLPLPPIWISIDLQRWETYFVAADIIGHELVLLNL